MKKILGYTMVLLLCFTLVGCKDKNEDIDYNENNNQNTSENENNDDAKWISTDDKLIFTDTNGYYMVFNYDGQTLETVQWIMDFEDNDTAQMAYNMYTSGYDTMYDVSISGTVVTLTYKEEYARQSYGAISKSDMEMYMENAGYIINKK